MLVKNVSPILVLESSTSSDLEVDINVWDVCFAVSSIKMKWFRIFEKKMDKEISGKWFSKS